MLYFRCTLGAMGVVQAWRVAMMRVRTAEFVNDQGIFNQVIMGHGPRCVHSDATPWPRRCSSKEDA